MQSIERTFSILRALADHPERAGISELARRTGLAKSTTSRILVSLESLGMVERIGEKYGIGAGLATLTHGSSPIGSLRELSRPELVELADHLGENTSLAVDDRDQVLYIDTATPSNVQVQVQDWTGERLPFHAAAAGLSLMATWDRERLAAYLARKPEAFTERTVTTNAGLRRKLKEVASVGAVWTLREYADDVNGVGAPIVGPSGQAVGSINIYGPDYRFPGERDPDAIVRQLTAACDRISDRLGQRGHETS